jgi:hypothetical protein
MPAVTPTRPEGPFLWYNDAFRPSGMLYKKHANAVRPRAHTLHVNYPSREVFIRMVFLND